MDPSFFLTLTNPATILSFVAIFAGLGLVSAGANYLSAVVLVLGVFVGSAVWWLLLSGGVSLFRTRFNTRTLHWVNRISGVVIAAFGVFVLVGLR
jgi:arginine exporter protein ArgO